MMTQTIYCWGRDVGGMVGGCDVGSELMVMWVVHRGMALVCMIEFYIG